MSTTAVVVIVVAVVLLIVIGVMVALRKRSGKPTARSASDRYLEEWPIPAPGASAADNFRDPPVDDEYAWPPLPNRQPVKPWPTPDPFEDRRTPMIRKEWSTGPGPELFDDSPTSPASVPEPARCEPIAWGPWASAQRDLADARTPAEIADAQRGLADVADTGSTRHDPGPAPSYGSGADSGSPGGDGGGSGGGCD